jgi:hypothetical protein
MRTLCKMKKRISGIKEDIKEEESHIYRFFLACSYFLGMIASEGDCGG